MLLDLLLKSAFVLAAASAISAIWRGASAAQRHLVWVLAFAALLLLPFTHFATPRWTWHTPTVRATFTPANPASVAPATVPSVSPATSRTLPPWRDVTVVAWLAGAVGLLAFRGVGLLRLWRLHRHSQPLNDPRLPSRISLRHSPDCAVPLMWGVWRPVVMLPSAALAWPEQNRNTALRHELAHVQRRDWLTRLAAQCLCALYWPNPLVWLAARSLRLAQEQACDDAVLRDGVRADEYASLLCSVARSSGQYAVAMAQPSTLERRICAIVDERRNRSTLGRWTTVAGVLLVAVVVAGGEMAQVAKEKPKTQVMLEAKIIEAPAGALKTLPVSDEETVAALKTLTTMKGVDVLSAPKVTTLDGQKAEICVGREVAEVKDEKGESLFEGIRLSLLPEMRDEKIVVTANLTVRQRLPGAKEPLSATSFSTRELNTKVAVRPGGTILLGGAENDGRVLFVALTAALVKELTAVEKAAKIMIPQVSFQDAALDKVVDLLAKKSQELDPDKQGVKITLQAAPADQLPRITLVLRNVPLIEALKYVAALADLELAVEPDSLRLAPRKKN